MNKQVILCLLLTLAGRASATEQYPDKLTYKNIKLELQTGWGNPSPLQTYFFQKKIDYPFYMISTANYRGHIANWVIVDEKLYLQSIDVNRKNLNLKNNKWEGEDKKYYPGDLGIKANDDCLNLPNLVFADWFSGIIDCHERDLTDSRTLRTFIFQIRLGRIIMYEEFTNEYYDKIDRNDTSDNHFKNMQKLRDLYDNYVSYYYRLSENDEILFKNKACQLQTSYIRLGPIYSYFSNDHLSWIYNWENLDKSGAPHCKWKINKDSLWLTSLQLYRGTSFDSIDKEEIQLFTLFPKYKNVKEVFANWVNGIELIVSGIDTTDKYGYKSFVPKEYTFCRFINGIVKETFHFSAFEFDKKEPDAKIKQLLAEY